jgi:hypothetical protein
MVPKVTFGIIVLNGEPFIRYNLRALYPFAHQIIVVEGAAPAAAGNATADGHSTDTTLRTLRDFKAREDPENKLVIVSAEDEGHPDGFWQGEKDEQSQAYTIRATGDYLWQVDVDEFYRGEDISLVLSLLENQPGITAMTFKQVTFWGGFNIVTDSWYLRREAVYCHRLFRWGPGYKYVTHRPPTVVNQNGRNLRSIHWINGKKTERLGIIMYHYSLLFPKQVFEKCDYYQQSEWAKRKKAIQWAKHNYMHLEHPYQVHNVYDFPSWLQRYKGPHPEQIEKMRTDIYLKRINISMRDMDDVKTLLDSQMYHIGIAVLKVVDYIDRVFRIPFRIIRKIWYQTVE